MVQPSPILLFLSAVLTALATENALFTRALGLTPPVTLMKGPKSAILFGGLFTWMAGLCSLCVALINFLLADNPYVMIIRAPLYMLSVALVYLGTLFLCRRLPEQTGGAIRRALPAVTFNTALFGAFYISSSQNFNFFQTVGYALGTGIGYTLAVLIVYYARKRLAISPVPRSFRGLPILLIYLGFLSLAIYGLIGHSLPT